MTIKETPGGGDSGKFIASNGWDSGTPANKRVKLSVVCALNIPYVTGLPSAVRPLPNYRIPAFALIQG